MRSEARGIGNLRLALIVVGSMAAGCGGETDLPPLQATSPHFRLHARSANLVPVGTLDRLERHRADVSTYMGIVDDHVIDYFLFDDVDDAVRNSGCPGTVTCAPGWRVMSTVPLDEHELTHAYLAATLPPPIISEGVANAFRCGTTTGTRLPSHSGWAEVVSTWPIDQDVYAWGVRLVLSLIRDGGPERFFKYYRAARYSLDPALFALDFQSSWGRRLDDVWAGLVETSSVDPGADLSL